jgi:uncharacterized protein
MRLATGLHDSVNWVVKASKLCNLRCRYCYEWNELTSPARVSLSQWKRLITSIRWYHQRRSRASTRPFQTIIIWHGGEPLLLPPEYIAAVMHLQRDLLGEELASGLVENTLQTNLYRITDEQLDLLEREGITIGVSMDVLRGVRLDARGAETEERVAENMDRLSERGIPFGAIAVLAGHTKDRLLEVYGFYEGLGVPLRVLPLFDAPLNVPGATFRITETEIVAALQTLFRHWLTRRRPIPVYPLIDYLDVALKRRRGESQEEYDREVHGEWALLVNTDGALYQVMDAYDAARALGNVFEQPLDDIFRAAAYRDSLAREREMRARMCGGCTFLGACSTLPLFEARRKGWTGERCAIAYDMHTFVERHLRERRMGERRIRGFLKRVRA